VDAIIDDGARTVDEIGRRCGAGTGCGACVEELHQRLAAKGAAGCSRDCGADGTDDADTRDMATDLVALRVTR
jgi:NAD(P)H-nitrite reductase large subunit